MKELEKKRIRILKRANAFEEQIQVLKKLVYMYLINLCVVQILLKYIKMFFF